jgi:hypothetical protein
VVISQTEKWAVHQERRSEIGRNLKLNVGPPNEQMFLANTTVVTGRDEVGLLRSTDRYASQKCKQCYGRGLYRVVKPITAAVALTIVKQNPANEAMIHQPEPGKYQLREERHCECSIRSFSAKRKLFVDALVNACLAKVVRLTTNEHGYLHQIVELL